MSKYVAILVVLVALFGFGPNVSANTATLNGGGSLFQFVGDSVVIHNHTNMEVYVKCVQEWNDGIVVPVMENSSSDSYSWGNLGMVTCFVVNAAERQALANNNISVTGFFQETAVPVLAYAANAKRGTKMAKIINDNSAKLIMDGKTGNYAAPPKYIWFPAVSRYVVGTVNRDVSSEGSPFKTTVRSCYYVWGNHHSDCLTGTGIFDTYHDQQPLWLTGVSSWNICGEPMGTSMLFGFGLDVDDNIILPSVSSSATGWVIWERGGLVW